MPFIYLEHTDNIYTTDLEDLFKSIQEILIKLADVKSINCKSSSVQFNNYYTESNSGFVHAEINILEGRTTEIKKQIGEETLKLLKAYFIRNIDSAATQYSVEIREMKSMDYFTSNSL